MNTEHTILEILRETYSETEKTLKELYRTTKDMIEEDSVSLEVNPGIRVSGENTDIFTSTITDDTPEIVVVSNVVDGVQELTLCAKKNLVIK